MKLSFHTGELSEGDITQLHTDVDTYTHTYREIQQTRNDEIALLIPPLPPAYNATSESSPNPTKQIISFPCYRWEHWGTQFLVFAGYHISTIKPSTYSHLAFLDPKPRAQSLYLKEALFIPLCLEFHVYAGLSPLGHTAHSLVCSKPPA